MIKAIVSYLLHDLENNERSVRASLLHGNYGFRNLNVLFVFKELSKKEILEDLNEFTKEQLDICRFLGTITPMTYNRYLKESIWQNRIDIYIGMLKELQELKVPEEIWRPIIEDIVRDDEIFVKYRYLYNVEDIGLAYAMVESHIEQKEYTAQFKENPSVRERPLFSKVYASGKDVVIKALSGEEYRIVISDSPKQQETNKEIKEIIRELFPFVQSYARTLNCEEMEEDSSPVKVIENVMHFQEIGKNPVYVSIVKEVIEVLKDDVKKILFDSLVSYFINDYKSINQKNLDTGEFFNKNENYIFALTLLLGQSELKSDIITSFKQKELLSKFARNIYKFHTISHLEKTYSHYVKTCYYDVFNELENIQILPRETYIPYIESLTEIHKRELFRSLREETVNEQGNN